jgi:predicted aspartyl protease
MNGHVDPSGRALVTVSIHAPQKGASRRVQAWIDTGFNGDLVLPQAQIDDLKNRAIRDRESNPCGRVLSTFEDV